MQDPKNLRQQMDAEEASLQAIQEEIQAARGRIAEAHRQIEAAKRAIEETEREIEQLAERSRAVEKRKALLEQYMELLEEEAAVAPESPVEDSGQPTPRASRDPAPDDRTAPGEADRPAPDSLPEDHLIPAENGDGATQIAAGEAADPAAGHEQTAEGLGDLDETLLDNDAVLPDTDGALLDTDLGDLPAAQVSGPQPSDGEAAVGQDDSSVDFENLDEVQLSTEILPRTQTFEEELLLLMAYHRKALRVRDVIRTFRRLDYTPKINVDKAIRAHVEGSPQFFEHVAEGRYVLTHDGRSEAERLLRQFS